MSYDDQYGSAIRYAAGPEPEMAAFHRTMHENPTDATPVLIYADWLEENGHPEAAEVIRHHVKSGGMPLHQHPYMRPYGDEDYWLDPGQIGFGHFGNSREGTVAVRQRSASDPGRLFLWHFTGPTADRSRLLDSARKNGEKLTDQARWFLSVNPPPRDTSGTDYGHS